MAQSTATKAHAPSGAPSVSFDEELWFGTNDGEAAENAAAQSMAATAGKLLGAKPFPESARKLAELSSKDSTAINEYVQVLEQDPALSAKLLKILFIDLRRDLGQKLERDGRAVPRVRPPAKPSVGR